MAETHNSSSPDILSEAIASWEARYAGSTRTWSGKPNAALVTTAQDLTPGRALDIGCGEGADVLWLAQQGWQVDGLDVSETAISRARAAADEAGFAGATKFHVGDLLSWASGKKDSFDLVTAMFLHVYDGQDRQALFEAMGYLVAPGGRVLIVSHANPPPWAKSHGHDHPSITPQDDQDLLGNDHQWEVEVAEIQDREGRGPDGQTGTLEDSILLMRKL